MSKNNISIIGLGKLGACMAAVYGSKGHNVIGVDLNEAFVKAINNKTAPVNEYELQEYIIKSQNRLIATTDTNEAITASNITFIIVPTPSVADGSFSVSYVEAACQNIGSALKNKKDYHLIVLTSTVLPGDSQKKIIPVLEKYSGKKCGKDFGFCYSPEFIAIGSVVHDLLNPDFLLVGSYDKKSEEIIREFYSTISDNNAPIITMNIPSAELTKISLNAYITTKIAFSNMVGSIADKVPGADIDAITGALGNDKRIGSKYLKCGLGFGGPCFPRDNVAFAHIAAQYGVDALISKATHSLNQNSIPSLVNDIVKNSTIKHKIGILGLSYKPGTPVVEESQSIIIVQELIKKGYAIYVYEPSGYEHASKLLGKSVVYCSDVNQILEATDLYFISYPHKEFKKVATDLKNHSSKIVFDPWRSLRNENINKSNMYFGLGLNKQT